MKQLLLVGWLFLAPFAAADEPRVKKVLVIGIDGCRTDVILEGQTPNLHKLIRDGAFCKTNDILGPRKTGADTVTMPGWAAILTGVWADKHGIRDNEAPRPTLVPTFFSRLREARPRTSTFGLASFRSIVDRIFIPEDGVRVVLDGSTAGFDRADQLVADTAVDLLTKRDPTAAFVYFGQVDTAGHVHGFHPKVSRYAQAIANVDAQVGRVLEALAKRPHYAAEDWLIIVCSDHGGRGIGHRGGHAQEEIRRNFLIVSGPAAEKGAILNRTENVDVAVTALTHLGVAIRPAWRLDGRSVGLRVEAK